MKFDKKIKDYMRNRGHLLLDTLHQNAYRYGNDYDLWGRDKDKERKAMVLRRSRKAVNDWIKNLPD